MARSRARAKGRRGGEVEHFAKIPVSVLESEACRTLDHAAFKVLVCLASGYSGRNNGALAMTPRFAERFGFNSRDTLYKALRTLEEHGLILKTRQGIKMKNVFTLYALGWADIDSREGQPLEQPETRNNKRWLDWTEKKLRTDYRTQPVPATGTDGAKCVPIAHTRTPICVPVTGNTLRSRPGASSERASDAAFDLDARILKLIRTQPHLPDGDVAKIMKADAMRVARLRQVEFEAREIEL